ncbi:hypothetical protein GCM10027343_39750 [Noviherbaspirillum agri]
MSARIAIQAFQTTFMRRNIMRRGANLRSNVPERQLTVRFDTGDRRIDRRLS